MKFSVTYRFIASVLSLSILIGVSVPAGLHSMSAELCDVMQKMGLPMQPGSHHAEDCPMAGQLVEVSEDHHQTDNTHHNAHDFGFACACSVDEAPVKTEAPMLQKVKTQVLAVVQVLAESHITKTEFDSHSSPISDSYSPPPIYLANESFLI